MRTYVILVILMVLFFENNAQSYQSKIIPFDGNPTVAGITNLEDEFIVSVASFLEDTASSTFIFLDGDLNSLEEVEKRGFAINNGGLIENKGTLFAFGNNNLENQFMTLLKTSDLFDQTDYFQFHSNSEFNFATTSTWVDDHLYALTVDEYVFPERRDVYLQKIDQEGTEVWNMTYGKNETFTSGIDLQSTESGFLLLGTIIIVEGSFFAEINKLNQAGDEIWTYRSQEHLVPGYSPHWTTELSNKQLVNISTVDRGQDLEFISNNWSDRPPKLVWLDSTGNLLNDTLLTSDELEPYVYSGIKKGIGDYFFIFGKQENTNLLNGDYGWLCKMTNEGQVIWNRKYHHPDFFESGDFHNIKTILELDNGDLITIGTTKRPGQSQQIWAMRLDSDGCFEDETCGDITNATEIYPQIKEVIIFPNPSSGLVYLDIDKNSGLEIESFSVLDAKGETMYSELYPSQEHLNLTHLTKGFYFVRLNFKNGQFYYKKLILN